MPRKRPPVALSRARNPPRYESTFAVETLVNDDIASIPNLSPDDSLSDLPDADPVLADAERLHARLLAARRAHRQSYYALITLLCEMADSGAFAVLGYSRLADYAHATLDLSSRQTRELLAVGRRLRELPAIAAAMAAGKLDWTKVREILRVTDADNEAAWADFAERSTTREVEARVAKAAPGDRPTDAPEHDDPRGSLRRRFIEVEATDDEVISLALAAARSDCANSDEIPDGVALATICARYLEDRRTVQNPPSGERYRVVVRLCPGCSEVTTVDGEVVTDTVASEVACDHEEVDLTPGPHVGHLTRAIPPALRRRVLDRDDYRCAVPRCGNRLWIDVHHLQPREEGGRHDIDNLAVLCPCHHRLVHEGRLAVERGRDGRIEVRGP